MDTATEKTTQQGHSKDAAGRVEGAGEVYDECRRQVTLRIGQV